MYIAPDNIDKILKNIIRISRKTSLLCEQHTDGKSFYDDKWIHIYNSILESIPEVKTVNFHSIFNIVWCVDCSKFGKIIEINKN